MSTKTLLCDQPRRTYTAQFKTSKRQGEGQKVIGNLERDGRSLRQFTATVKTVMLLGVAHKRIRVSVGSSGGSITFTWK